MLRKTTLMVLAVVVLGEVCPVQADLVFSSGHNIYDDSYGYNHEVWVENDSVLDVLGGGIGKLETMDFTTANLYGGVIDWLWTDDSSVVNIYGGEIIWLLSGDDSLVCLYAHDVTYHPQAPYPGHPVYGNSAWIEGIYLRNDTPFSFGVGPRGEAYSHIQIVPEPTVLLMLGLGSLLIIRKK
jgi:hypothetical protein